jgi:hypothetical protein
MKNDNLIKYEIKMFERNLEFPDQTLNNFREIQ